MSYITQNPLNPGVLFYPTPFQATSTASTTFVVISGYNPTRTTLEIFNQSTTSTEYLRIKYRADILDTAVELTMKVAAGTNVVLTGNGEFQLASTTGTPTFQINEY